MYGRSRRRNPTTKCPSCGTGNKLGKSNCWDCGASMRKQSAGDMFFGTRSSASSRTGFISRYGRRYRNNPEEEELSGPVEVIAPAEPIGVEDEIPLLGETPAEAARRYRRRRRYNPSGYMRNPECPKCVCDPCECAPCPECVCDPCECPSASRYRRRRYNPSGYMRRNPECPKCVCDPCECAPCPKCVCDPCECHSASRYRRRRYNPLGLTSSWAPCFECGKATCGCGCGGDQDLCSCTNFRFNPCGTGHGSKKRRPRRYNRYNPMARTARWAPCFGCGKASCGCGCEGNAISCVCGGSRRSRRSRRRNPWGRYSRRNPSIKGGRRDCASCGESYCGCGCGGNPMLCTCTARTGRKGGSLQRERWGRGGLHRKLAHPRIGSFRSRYSRNP